MGLTGLAVRADGDTHPPANCSQAATIAVTIIAGPLNYLGVNPKISCSHLPQPSK